MSSIIAILLFGLMLTSMISVTNLNHMRIMTERGLPQNLISWFPSDRLKIMVDYTRARTFLSLAISFSITASQVAIFASGLLPWLATRLSSSQWPAFWQGLVTLAIPSLMIYLLSLPGSLWSDFVIERRYGFSTITPATWLGDRIKGLFISTVILGLIFWGFHLFLSWFGHSWWLAAWILVVLFSLLISFVAPIILMPLFNKFTPIPDRELSQKILHLAQRAGFPLSGVFQMDASRRSTHDNAFFTGLGKTRRIVFFDTMLQNYNHDELLSVLGHEIGHWKLGHIPKMLLISSLFSGIGLYLTDRMLMQPWLYEALGVIDLYNSQGPGGPMLGLTLFTASALLSPLGMLISPLANWISRRHEYQADAYALKLHQQAEALKSALVKLSSKNLSNLFPHPLYVAFHYSHPPLVERLKAIDGMAAQAASGRR